MGATLYALAPIFGLIVFGWGMKRIGFPGDAFWPALDRVVYYLMFPALIIHTLATSEVGDVSVLRFGGVAITSVLAMTAVLLLIRRWLPVDGPGFSSFVQGGIRFNAYSGFAIAQTLYGVEALALFSLVIAFVTPTANTVSVIALVRYGGGGRMRWRDVLVGVARNPIIISIVVGLALNGFGIGLPWALEPFLKILASAALPLGLLSVGVGLDFAAVRAAGGKVALACLIRLMGMPLIVIGVSRLFGIDGVAAIAILIYATLPVSPVTYIQARQHGGDATLMASIVTGTLLGAFVTIPFWLAIVG